MFHGSCRKVSRVLGLSMEPVSKSTVHYLARKVSATIRLSSGPKGVEEAWNISMKHLDRNIPLWLMSLNIYGNHHVTVSMSEYMECNSCHGRFKLPYTP